MLGQSDFERPHYPLYVSPQIIYDGSYDAKVFKRNHIGNFDFQYQTFDNNSVNF